MMRASGIRGAVPAGGSPVRGLEWGALFATLGLIAVILSSCSGPASGIVYQSHTFKIHATTAFSGTLVDQTTTTTVSGSSDQAITLSASSGNDYTLTIWKSASDGQPLEAQLIANETVNGVATTVIVDDQTTTDPNVPVRLVLID